jgi:hypothetical protein
VSRRKRALGQTSSQSTLDDDRCRYWLDRAQRFPGEEGPSDTLISDEEWWSRKNLRLEIGRIWARAEKTGELPKAVERVRGTLAARFGDAWVEGIDAATAAAEIDDRDHQSLAWLAERAGKPEMRAT